ncbi:unnamed protein product [Effrenium voratum]|nr:unnamed protein product [Effrenium voratum]
MRRVEIPQPHGSARVLEIAADMTLADESGVCVWDSALCLGEMLIKRQLEFGPTVLELGAGTGYVGLVAAALGGRVLLTDRAVLVPLLKANIESNHLQDCANALELEWGTPSSLKVDTVLMSDCVYLPAAFRDLSRTLNGLEARQVLWAQEMRGVEEEFHELMRSSGWLIEEVRPPADNDFACDEIRVFRAKRWIELRGGFPVFWPAAAALAWHGPLICAGFRREYKLFSERISDRVGVTPKSFTHGRYEIILVFRCLVDQLLRGLWQSFFHFGTTSDAPSSTFRSLQRAWIARDSGIRSGAMVAKEAIALETQLHRPWAVSAACSAQGPRPQNEDVHVMLCEGLPEGPAPNIKAAGLPGLFDDLPEMVSGPSLPQAEPQKEALDCLFAVFDGHGGAAAARACAERVPTEIREESFGFGERISFSMASGGLGSVIRSIACRVPTGYEVAAQTKDHTPNAPEEEKRIKAAGGKVEVFPGSRVPVMRVDGFLGCSRALGDFRFKEDAALLPEQQKVSAVPEVYEFEAEAGDAIVLACDGVFDVLSSDKALVSPGLQKKEPSAAATAVVQAALADPRQQDNVTCVVALLQ